MFNFYLPEKEETFRCGFCRTIHLIPEEDIKINSLKNGFLVNSPKRMEYPKGSIFLCSKACFISFNLKFFNKKIPFNFILKFSDKYICSLDELKNYA